MEVPSLEESPLAFLAVDTRQAPIPQMLSHTENTVEVSQLMQFDQNLMVFVKTYSIILAALIWFHN